MFIPIPIDKNVSIGIDPYPFFKPFGAGELGSRGFMIPWIQGQLIDVAVDAAARYAKGGPEVPTGWAHGLRHSLTTY